MYSKPFFNTELPLEGRITNLQKRLFEKPNRKSLHLLQESYTLSQDPTVPTTLQVYTVINLSNFYIKSRKLLDALKILTELLGKLNTSKEFIWEKALILSSLGNIKSLSGSHEDALHSLSTCIKLLSVLKPKNINYYTVLVTAYYNCFVESRILGKSQEAMEYLIISKKIALKCLGLDNSLYKFLNNFDENMTESFFDKTKLYNLNTNVNEIRLSTIKERSRSNVDELNETNGKMFKDVRKPCAVTPMPRKNGVNKNLRMYNRVKLSRIDDEDEFKKKIYVNIERNQVAYKAIGKVKNAGNDKNQRFKIKGISSSEVDNWVLDGGIENQIEDFGYYKKNEDKIIMIQKKFRGILARKKFVLLKKENNKLKRVFKGAKKMKTLQSRVREAMRYNECKKNYVNRKVD